MPAMAATGFTTPSVLRKALHSFLPLRLTHIRNTLFYYKNLRSFPLSTHLNSSGINHVSQGNTHLLQRQKHVSFGVSNMYLVSNLLSFCVISNTHLAESSETSNFCCL